MAETPGRTSFLRAVSSARWSLAASFGSIRPPTAGLVGLGARARRTRRARWRGPARDALGATGVGAVAGGGVGGERTRRAGGAGRLLEARPGGSADADGGEVEPAARGEGREASHAGKGEEDGDRERDPPAGMAARWLGLPEGRHAGGSASRLAPEDLGELVGRGRFQLVVAAVGGRPVGAPADEVGRVPEPVALEVVVGDLGDALDPQRLPARGPCRGSSARWRRASAARRPPRRARRSPSRATGGRRARPRAAAPARRPARAGARR